MLLVVIQLQNELLYNHVSIIVAVESIDAHKINVSFIFRDGNVLNIYNIYSSSCTFCTFQTQPPWPLKKSEPPKLAAIVQHGRFIGVDAASSFIESCVLYFIDCF